MSQSGTADIQTSEGVASDRRAGNVRRRLARNSSTMPRAVVRLARAERTQSEPSTGHERRARHAPHSPADPNLAAVHSPGGSMRERCYVSALVVVVGVVLAGAVRTESAKAPAD